MATKTRAAPPTRTSTPDTDPRTPTPTHVRDIAIIGAGPAGMATALIAARLGYSIALFDGRAAGAWQGDPRAIALSEGSRQLLASLGAWPIAGASPIREVHISQRGGFGRTLLTAKDMGLATLGHVLAYDALCDALHQALAQYTNTIDLHWQTRIDKCEADVSACRVTSKDSQLGAALLVHAEGVASAADATWGADYQQDALLCTASPLKPHGQRAWERFTPQGPVALLPQGKAFAVVYVLPRDSGSELEHDDAAFLAALTERFAGRLQFSAVSQRSRVPLHLRLRAHPDTPRSIWLASAAQSLHPVSGQGLNLGLRDVACLGELLAKNPAMHAETLTADPGAISTYFRRSRSLDRAATVGLTDFLVRGFAGDFPPVTLARGLALASLDLIAPARRLLARQMIFGQRN